MYIHLRRCSPPISGVKKIGSLILQRMVMIFKFLKNKIPVFLIKVSSGRHLFFVFRTYTVIRFVSIIFLLIHIFEKIGDHGSEWKRINPFTHEFRLKSCPFLLWLFVLRIGHQKQHSSDLADDGIQTHLTSSPQLRLPLDHPYQWCVEGYT